MDPAGPTPDPTRDLLVGLGRIASELGGPLSQLASILLFPLLESQRVLLTSYQKALEDPAVHQASEDYAKALARALMASYLEALGSHRERREAFVKAQSALITSYLETLDAVLNRFGNRTP